MIRKIVGCNFFAEIDLTHAFHQIPLASESQPVTGFTDAEGKYCVWTVMVEGAKGAANHMQYPLERALQGVNEFTVPYIDNVLIYAKSANELAE